MGAAQFGDLKVSKYRLISDYLLPTKTKAQLTFRFKNLKTARFRDNSVKVKTIKINLSVVTKYRKSVRFKI